MRTIGMRELVHDRLGEGFERALSLYDTQRRVEVLVDEFLGTKAKGAAALDVGCGLGYFSKRLVELGADVTACDLGPEMVRLTAQRAGCEAKVADALDLGATFPEESFDIVVSSECIEHTPAPYDAVREMIAMVKPGGLVAISTPNLVWQPIVKAATLLKLRPFDGLENFSTWTGLQRTMADNGVDVVATKGLHLFPFQFGLHGVSRWLDENAQPMRGFMINLCILGRKR